MRFTILGKIQPYTRTTQKQKFVDERYQRYRASQHGIRLQLRAQMRREGWEMLPERTPLDVCLWFYPADHRCDLDNLVKAVLDAAQGIVFKDDRWVDSICAVRGTGEQRCVLRVRVI